MDIVLVRLLLKMLIATLAMQSPLGWAQRSTADHAEIIEQSSAAELAINLGRDAELYLAVVDAAREGNDKALAAIAQAFGVATDSTLKRNLAIILLQNGTVSDEVVEYLSEPVLRVINLDIPFPYRFDLQGEILEGEFSQEFLSWCKSRQVGYPFHSGSPNILWLGSQLFSIPVGDDRAVGCRFDRHGLLNKAIEQLAAAA